MKTRIRFAVMMAALAVPSLGRAQEVNLATLDEPEANHAYVRTGAEHGFVAGAGYARGVRLLGRTILFSGELMAPWAGLDTGDYRVRLGVLVPILSYGGWKLAGTLAPTLRGTSNEAADMTGLGADAGLMGGYYAAHWFVAGELGADWEGLTHVEHSALYGRTVYEDARSGWYFHPQTGNYRYGLQAGASLDRYDVVLRAGQLRTAGWSKPLLPFYATLTVGARW